MPLREVLRERQREKERLKAKVIVQNDYNYNYVVVINPELRYNTAEWSQALKHIRIRINRLYFLLVLSTPSPKYTSVPRKTLCRVRRLCSLLGHFFPITLIM